MGKTQQKPQRIQLTAIQVERLKSRIDATDLDTEAKDIFYGLMSSCLWLQDKLQTSKITIAQLKSLFGITTEKKSLVELEMMFQEMEKIQENQK